MCTTKDPLAKRLFEFVEPALFGCGILLVVPGAVGGMAAGGWLGANLDAYFAGTALRDTLGPFTVFGILFGGIVTMLAGFQLWGIELKEKNYSWRFFDYITDLLSALIRGIGATLAATGVGIVAGLSAIVALALIRLYCDTVGVPFPTVPALPWQAFLIMCAFAGITWQFRRGERATIL